MNRLFKTLHHLGVPSHRNNYRAKALHLDFLVALIGVLTIFSLTTGVLEKSGVLGYANDIRIDRLYALTNESRTAEGLPALRYNDNLARAAQNKAQHMLENNYWAHFGAGKTPWDFILDSGYSYEVAGENLAKGFMDSESVLRGWENSPTHYANIVRPEYDEIGFAVQNGILEGEEITLVVQMFGKQISQANTTPSAEETQVAQDAPSQELQEVEASGVVNDSPAKAPVEAIARAAAVPAAQPAVASSFISSSAVSFNWTVIIIGFLLSILFLDLYFANKLHLIRLTSKNVAHIIFLTSLFVGLMIIKNGVIL